MTKKAVFTRFGEISYTPASFNCFLEDFKGSLEEKRRYLFSSDDWRLTEPELRHSVIEVDIPDWIPEFCHVNYMTSYDDIGRALRVIEKHPDRPFYKSLISFLADKGYLTRRQIQAVLHPERRRNRDSY